VFKKLPSGEISCMKPSSSYKCINALGLQNALPITGFKTVESSGVTTCSCTNAVKAVDYIFLMNGLKITGVYADITVVD